MGLAESPATQANWSIPFINPRNTGREHVAVQTSRKMPFVLWLKSRWPRDASLSRECWANGSKLMVPFSIWGLPAILRPLTHQGSLTRDPQGPPTGPPTTASTPSRFQNLFWHAQHLSRPSGPRLGIAKAVTTSVGRVEVSPLLYPTKT